MDDDEVTPTRQIVTRKQARATRDQVYWNGRPCHAGHIEGRSTASGICMECNRFRANKHRLAYPEECRARSRVYQATHKAERTARRLLRLDNARAAERNRSARWVKANPEKHRTQQLRWKRDNKEQRRVSWRRYYLANVERIAARGRTYAVANRGKVAANTRNYNARKLKAEGPSYSRRREADLRAAEG